MAARIAPRRFYSAFVAAYQSGLSAARSTADIVHFYALDGLRRCGTLLRVAVLPRAPDVFVRAGDVVVTGSAAKQRAKVRPV
jgi:hypothetical protein